MPWNNMTFEMRPGALIGVPFLFKACSNTSTKDTIIPHASNFAAWGLLLIRSPARLWRDLARRDFSAVLCVHARHATWNSYLHTLLLMLKTRINHAEYDVITRPVHDATYRWVSDRTLH